MTYAEALAAADKVGASNAVGLPLLAQTISVLGMVHAINAELTFNGAVRQNLTAAEVRKLSAVALGNLMFE